MWSRRMCEETAVAGVPMGVGEGTTTDWLPNSVWTWIPHSSSGDLRKGCTTVRFVFEQFKHEITEGSLKVEAILPYLQW